MSEQIVEIIDTRPAEVREFMAMIEAEIAKVFAVPAWALREPDAYHQWRIEAYRATEDLRRQLVRLWSLYPRGLLIAADAGT